MPNFGYQIEPKYMMSQMLQGFVHKRSEAIIQYALNRSLNRDNLGVGTSARGRCGPDFGTPAILGKKPL